jgi:hypothetical protein
MQPVRDDELIPATQGICSNGHFPLGGSYFACQYLVRGQWFQRRPRKTAFIDSQVSAEDRLELESIAAALLFEGFGRSASVASHRSMRLRAVLSGTVPA